MKWLCAINHQLDNRTIWCVGWMKRLLLFDLHSRTMYTCLLALLVDKIFEVIPTSPKALTCWISQILNIHFTCIEYLWSAESENHIGSKRKIVVLNRLFHGNVQWKPSIYMYSLTHCIMSCNIVQITYHRYFLNASQSDCVSIGYVKS